MFFMVNWIFLVALIYMGFKIRWIRDNLSINTELQQVVAVWVIACTF
jgi:hypothetical protein